MIQIFVQVHKNSEDHFINQEEYVVYCGATTLQGSPCKNPSIEGKSTCYHHSAQSMEIKVEIPEVDHVSTTTNTPSTSHTHTTTQSSTDCASLTVKGTCCSRKGTREHDGKMYCTQHYTIVSK